MQEVALEVQANIIDQQAFYVSIASCAVSLLLLILTTLSVLCAYKAYQHQKQRAFKDAACDLAKIYVLEIIEKYDFISSSMASAGLTKKIKNVISYDFLCNFDKGEMEQILKNQNIDYQNFKNEMYQINEGLSKQIKMILNNLELFAMSCQYKLADEEMLYQSLHNSFLSYMWLFSFYICDINENSEDKMFTNAIWLFNTWKERLQIIKIKNRKAHQIIDDDTIFKGEPL